MNREMQKALEADGDKLRALTGEDHGPFCPHCLGTGTVADYVGLEMKAVAVDCPHCYGTGIHNKLND